MNFAKTFHRSWTISVSLLFSMILISVAKAQVEPRTGFYRRSWTDLTVPHSANMLEVLRTYAEPKMNSVVYKGHWCSNWDMRITDVKTDFPKLVSCDVVTRFVRDRSALPEQVFRSVLNPAANLTSTKQANQNSFVLRLGDEKSYHFDSAGRLSSVDFGVGAKVDLSYEGANLVSVHGEKSGLVFKYDEKGLLTEVADIADNQNKVQYFYNQKEGSLMRVAAGSSAAGASKNTQPLLMSYDPQGRLAQVRSGKNLLESLSYLVDTSAEVQRYQDPQRCVETFERKKTNVASLPAQVKMTRVCPKRPTVITEFDLWIDSVSNPNPFVLHEIVKNAKTGAVLSEREYDPTTKQLKVLKTPQGVSRYDYDSSGRVSSLTQEPEKQTSKFIYTADSIRPSHLLITKPAGSVDYKISYNQKNQVQALVTQDSKGTERSVQMRYDANDRLVEIKDLKGILLRAMFTKAGAPKKIQKRKQASDAELHEWTTLLNTISVSRQQTEIY